MPNINLDSIETSDITTDGAFTPLPAGGYVCKIVDVEDVPAREYFWIVIDIAEGEHAGYYADAWGVGHPAAHRVLISYKQTALGMLKGRLKMLTDSNPGFDAIAAFQGDNWTAFLGKTLGLIVGEEEYESNTGEVRTRLNWFNALWRTPAQIRKGGYRIPQTKTLKAGDAKPPRDAPADDETIPFY